MTLTSPGCPVAGTLPGEVQQKIVPAVVCLVAAIVLVNTSNMVTALGAIY